MNKIYTTNEIAKQLGIKRNKCVILLKNIEQSRNIKILFKKGESKQSKFYTTEEILQSVMPELFQEDVFTLDTIKGLKEKVIDLEKKINSLSVKMKEMENGKC